MRCALIFGLVACWLAVIGLHAHSRRPRPAPLTAQAVASGRNEKPAQSKPRPAKASTNVAEPIQTWIVRGAGRATPEEALKSALENARSHLLGELNGLARTDRGEAIIDVEYVRRQFWKDLRKDELQRKEPAIDDRQPDALGIDELKIEEVFTDGHWVVNETREQNDNLVPKTHQVSIKIGVSLQDRADLQQQIRQHRMGDRMLGLGKLLGVVVLLLGGVAGYLRLDEWTKGYYTTWLRLGVLGLIGIAGMGYWLLP